MKLLLILSILSSLSYSKSLVDILRSDTLTVKKGVELHSDDEGDMWTTSCYVRIQNHSSETELNSVRVEYLKNRGVSLELNSVDGAELYNSQTDIGDYYTRIRTNKDGNGMWDPIYQIDLEIIEGKSNNKYIDIKVSKLNLGGVFRKDWNCRVSL